MIISLENIIKLKNIKNIKVFTEVFNLLLIYFNAGLFTTPNKQ